GGPPGLLNATGHAGLGGIMHRLLFAALVAAAFGAAAASAQTLTLAVEGGAGFRLTAPVTPVGIGQRIDLPEPQPAILDFAARSPLVGRGEIGLLLPAGAGGFVIRVGGAAAAWRDGGTAEHALFGIVLCKASFGNERPECEIKVCEHFEP